MTDRQLYSLHDFCDDNKELIQRSKLCGCFCCCSIFNVKDIKEYHQDPHDKSAICPKCSVDSVLPGCVVKMDKKLLEAMHKRWFTAGISGKQLTREIKAIRKAKAKLTKREMRLLRIDRSDNKRIEW